MKSARTSCDQPITKITSGRSARTASIVSGALTSAVSTTGAPTSSKEHWPERVGSTGPGRVTTPTISAPDLFRARRTDDGARSGCGRIGARPLQDRGGGLRPRRSRRLGADDVHEPGRAGGRASEGGKPLPGDREPRSSPVASHLCRRDRYREPAAGARRVAGGVDQDERGESAALRVAPPTGT